MHQPPHFKEERLDLQHALKMENLTRMREFPLAQPWHVSNAPTHYVESQLKGIVGIEITIASIEGKWKVSQNRTEADREGVARGLAESQVDMTQLVRLAHR